MNRLLLLVLAGALAVNPIVHAQTTAADPRDQEQLATLMKEIRDQQTELASNQTKIDEKLAALAEAIRQARIYSSRTGK